MFFNEKQLTGWSEKDKPTTTKTVKKDDAITNKEKRRRSSVDIYDTKKSTKVVIDPNDYQVKKAAKRLRSMMKRQAANNNGNLKPSFVQIKIFHSLFYNFNLY